MSKKLRPCPWCDNDADYTILKLGSVHVSCDACGSQGPTGENISEAKKAWNYRIGSNINDQIGCLYEIRCILGDKAGKLMQNEIVERVREMADHFRKAKGEK